MNKGLTDWFTEIIPFLVLFIFAGTGIVSVIQGQVLITGIFALYFVEYSVTILRQDGNRLRFHQYIK